MDYYVRQNTGEVQNGTAEHPFSSISDAAEIAVPGDTIYIGDGIYREWVSPMRGGTDDECRITYKAIYGERPIISGAEIINGWEKIGESLYKSFVDKSLFGDSNPYETLLYGDWYNPMGQPHHTGEVFVDGKALHEAATLDGITEKNRGSWYCESDSDTVTFWVYLPDDSPENHRMEISVRPFGFFPKDEHINYITLSGVTVENVATQWAPPTAFQSGAVGPNWSKGWIIENCTVRGSKCVGISVGKRHDEDDNIWTRDPSKGGAQTYTEIIFRNLHRDWNKDTVGGHIIRNNHIYDCGQAGIVGCMGGIFSVVENNVIHDINNRGEFSGAEVAGIKLHAAIDVILRHNIIHDCAMGIWLDWQAQGARVSCNALYDNIQQDLFIEVCHGPVLVDRNLLLSKTSLLYMSQGTAFAHNIFAGRLRIHTEPHRFTMYHFPHETAVLGSIVVYGGDDKYFGNIFIGPDSGTNVYDGYHGSDYRPDTSKNDAPIGGIVNNTLGVTMLGNAYIGGAGIWEKETDAAVISGDAAVNITENDGKYSLSVKLPDDLFKIETDTVGTEDFSISFESGAGYENPDGSPLVIDSDFFETVPLTCPGPITGNIEANI